MSEEVTSASFEATTFADVLAPQNNTEAPAQVDAAPEVVEAPPQAEPVVEAKPAEVVPNPVDEQSRRIRDGLIKAAQVERRKRQEAEQQLAQFQSQQQQHVGQNQYIDNPEQFVAQQVNQVARGFEDRFTTLSERMARAAHPDYEEKYQAFQEAVAQNPDLLDVVLKDQMPGEAAYQMGKQLMFNKKYGTDLESIQKNIRAEAEKEIRAKVEQEFLGKVRQKTNQPTNILSQRAAGGDNAPEWTPTTWDDALSRRR